MSPIIAAIASRLLKIRETLPNAVELVEVTNLFEAAVVHSSWADQLWAQLKMKHYCVTSWNKDNNFFKSLISFLQFPCYQNL